MKIIDKIRDAVGMRTVTEEQENTNSIDANTKSATATAIGESISRSEGNLTLTTSQADKNWAHIAVAKIADVVAGTHWGLYKIDKDGNRVEVVQDVISSLMEQPNQLMTWRQFIYRLIGQRQFTGVSPVHITTNGNKVELDVLDSTRLTTKYDRYGRTPTSYRYIWPTTGTVQVMGVHEVKRFVKPDFFNNTGTSGISEHIIDWLKVENNNIKLQQDMAEFRSFVGGTLETNVTDEDTLKRWRDVLKKRTEKKGSDLVLPKGIKYERNTLSLKDLEMSTNDKENGAKILKAFGVPKELLGDVDTSGRANVDGAYYGCDKYTLDPLLQQLRELLNMQVFAELLDEGVYVDYENIVPEDEAFKVEARKASLGGNAWATVNEVRAEDDLDPVEGGDEIKAPVGNINTEPKKSVRQKALPNFVRTKMLNAKHKEAKKEEAVSKATDKVDWGAVELGLIEYNRKGFEVRTLTRAEALQENVLKMAEAQEATISKRLDKATKALEVGDVDELVALEVKGDAEEFYIESKDVLTAIAVDEGGNAVSMVANPAGNYNAESKALQKELKRVLMLRAVSANKTTQKNLAKEIKEGVKAGEGTTKLTKRVKAVFTTMEKYRAKQVAQDVAFTSANSAMRNAYTQVGIQEIKWFAGQDSKVCAFCNEMHGKTVGVQDNFFSKGDVFEVTNDDGKKQKMTVEFDDINTPPIHSNCRCYILPE